jgi:hypothetical protein
MKFAAAAALMFCLLAASSSADVLKAGDPVPEFNARDQHGNPFVFKPGPRFLLISFDMSTGKDANRNLEKKGAKFLDDNHLVFVSNIHGMPAIGRMFAMPKMKKYPHRIILADEEKLLDPFPRQKDRVTVLVLNSAGKVKEVRYWNADKQALDEVLKD